MGYGVEFRVLFKWLEGPVGGEGSIAKVSLVRLGVVTHRFDQNQRYIELQIVQQIGDTLKVAAPANGNLAPPGYYMLFIISDAGVPSVASYIQLK